MLLLMPLVHLLIFQYTPMYGLQMAFRSSMYATDIYGGAWIGLDNFIRFFSLPSAKQIIWNTAYLGLYSFVAGFPIPILFAIAINETRNKHFAKTVQNVAYMPFFISTVVLVGMVMQVLDTRIGIVGLMGRVFSFEATNILAKAEYFPSIYVWSGIWQGTGYSAIIYIAALAGVSQELVEACRIDGASKLQKVWYVDIPHIAPTMSLLLLLSFGSIMSIGFEKVYLMQNPLNIKTSEVINTYIYKVGLENIDFNFGSAVGLLNSLINTILLLVSNFIVKKFGHTSLW